MPTHFSSSVFFFFSFSCIGLICTKQHSTFWSNVHYRQPFSSLKKRVFFLCRHILHGRGCVLNIILLMKHHLYLYIFVSSCYKMYKISKKKYFWWRFKNRCVENLIVLSFILRDFIKFFSGTLITDLSCIKLHFKLKF